MARSPMKCHLFEKDSSNTGHMQVKTLRVGLIGPNHSGKSEFIKYLIKGNKYRNFEIKGSCHIKGLRVNYDEEKAFVLDVQEYTGSRTHQLQAAEEGDMNVYLLIYDLASKDSFREIKYQWLVHLYDMDMFTFVIGNKADVEEEHKVQTSVPEVSEMAWQAGHMEVSAITGANIDKLVQRMAEILLDLQVRNRADDLDNVSIKSITASSLALHDDYVNVPCYDMSGYQKGICLVINNQSFVESSKLSYRYGSDHDVRKISELFRSLGFQIDVHKNLTASQMIEILKQTAKASKLNTSKAFLCFVLSHGTSGAVYGADGNQVKLSKITKIFTAKNCQRLFDKPKLFFIQACRGNDRHESVRYEHDHFLSGSRHGVVSIPNEADFLVASSTVDGYVSFRDPTTGSIFINLLIECISDCKNLNLVDILTILNDKASAMDFPDNTKQMTVYQSTLRRRLILM